MFYPDKVQTVKCRLFQARRAICALENVIDFGHSAVPSTGWHVQLSTVSLFVLPSS